MMTRGFAYPSPYLFVTCRLTIIIPQSANPLPRDDVTYLSVDYMHIFFRDVDT